METLDPPAAQAAVARRRLLPLPSLSTLLLIILAINIVVDVMMRRHAPRLPVADRGQAMRVAGTDPN